MSDRKWPATKIGSAWMTHDPDDGWYEYDNPSDAESAFGQIVDHLRDEASEAWHESADTAAWGIWIPIERLRLVATAWPDDDTEDGERCKDAGWDAILDGVVERVEADSAALDFCGRRAAATISALRAERDEARAEVERLRAVIDNPGDIGAQISIVGFDRARLAHAETVTVTVTSAMIRDRLRARLGVSDV
jgi:hypothetical protein